MKSMHGVDPEERKVEGWVELPHLVRTIGLGRRRRLMGRRDDASHV
jgi:hypothetical protein